VMAKAKKSPTVTLDSLGCKLNQAEIQDMASQLARAGYRIVDATEKADIYILNTCTVTHIADRKSRHLLRLARRRNPGVRLIALGCYAQRAPQELKEIEGVELVLGNERKMELVKLLDDSVGLEHKFPAEATKQRDSIRRSRAFLKIQDGCQNYCAYCIVPYVRKHEESRPAGEIIDRIKEKTAGGFKEVVLTGTEIGEYNDGGTDLAGLMGRILKETDVTRLRLSSLQPHHISPGLIALWRDTRLCPHFHLSLQSGSDNVLKKMKRHYTAEGYRRAVKTIRDAIPDAAVTTDIIAGFPGETEAEFNETVEFCREMQFARIHVFPFSRRPGTAAATMPGQISDAVKKERSKTLLALAGEVARGFREQHLGEKAEVLWEQGVKGTWTGLTGNYIRVYMKSDYDLTDKLEPVRMIKIYRDGVWGEVV
jgi:threonylcarbamoyladenosine tRNA methylthiotransferase MtaB